ncbi:MAG: B12 binding domain protein [Syntrophorhabdaceae bacterium PtaU1.Bin034]|jgi:radical SAM superfamily enzyme YgiQ (UPF0313 family)|nr:MAG: B12 binding domain protein [Syntrophorhabdaceae bacterium PtaU1.Bin034]
MKKPLQVLLINPYIYDVSAYSFWSTPLGLLYVGGVLRENGMRVTLLDCLREKEEKRREDGRAPFIKERVESPEATKGTGKRYRRYGISREEVRTMLCGMATPDLVLVTCIMTYWYQGAREIVRLVRDMFPSAKIVVGGIYASLCYEHARNHMEGADLIVGNGDMTTFYSFIEESFSLTLRSKPQSFELDRMPYAAFDLYRQRQFVPLLTSFGCIYRCTYCASSYLYPRVVRRDPKSVLKEIMYWNSREISRFALYDDNFLSIRDGSVKELLLGISRLPFALSIYNPNALNASLIDAETAILLKKAHFQEVRLGLETIDPVAQEATGGKVTAGSFEPALRHLLNAGFPRKVIQAYVLTGLPLQKWEDVKKTIDYAASLGIKVNLAEYTPIPHTEMFEKYHTFARYPISEEPMFQNNALFPFAWEGFTEENLDEMKAYAREKNEEG